MGKKARADIDVTIARIMRGFGGEREARELDRMTRALLLGEVVEIVYKNQTFRLEAKVEQR
jgi:hypothetical protein